MFRPARSSFMLPATPPTEISPTPETASTPHLLRRSRNRPAQRRGVVSWSAISSRSGVASADHPPLNLVQSTAVNVRNLRSLRWRLGFAAGVCMLGATAGGAMAKAAQLRPASAPAPVSPAVSPPEVSLDAAGDAGAALPRLYSLLVSWRGELLPERYYNGPRATRPANIKSAAKS